MSCAIECGKGYVKRIRSPQEMSALATKGVFQQKGCKPTFAKARQRKLLRH
jgi:hypothetical protein